MHAGRLHSQWTFNLQGPRPIFQPHQQQQQLRHLFHLALAQHQCHALCGQQQHIQHAVTQEVARRYAPPPPPLVSRAVTESLPAGSASAAEWCATVEIDSALGFVLPMHVRRHRLSLCFCNSLRMCPPTRWPRSLSRRCKSTLNPGVFLTLVPHQLLCGLEQLQIQRPQLHVLVCGVWLRYLRFYPIETLNP